jgi:hypothetical protein
MGWNMGVAFWYPQYPKAQMQLTPSAIRLRYKFYEKALSHSSTQDTKHLLPSWLNFEFVWSLLCSCNGYTCCNHILNPLNVLKVFGFLLPHIFIMLFLLCARSNSFCISLCNGEWTRTLQPAQEVVPWPPPWATPHSSTKEHLSPIFLKKPFVLPRSCSKEKVFNSLLSPRVCCNSSVSEEGHTCKFGHEKAEILSGWNWWFL